MVNVLHITNELRFTCGITNHLLNVVDGFNYDDDVKLFIITGGGNGVNRFNNYRIKIESNNYFLHKNRNFRNFFKALVHLRQFIKDNEIDIVHSHNHYAANIANNASYTCKIKKVQTNHGLLKPEGKLKHFIADKYIAINEHILDYILDHKISKPEDVKLIRCGIKFPEEIPKKDSTKLKIISASRFTKEKALDLFIKAVCKIDRNIKSKCEFYLAGEGEEENHLRKLNDDLNCRIIFTGRIVNLTEFLNESHIFVFCGNSELEGYPAVITEAASTGNLIISSDFLGFDSVLKDNENSLIFTKNDEEQLKNRLTYAITNYLNLCDLTNNAFIDLKKLFDRNKMITDLKSLYLECTKV
jgi:glycosyltransferase involved in cell wall biosynthesis